MLINFEVFCETTKDEYLIVQITNNIEPSESDGNFNNGSWSGVTNNSIYESLENSFMRKFHITKDFKIINHHDNILEFKYSESSVIYPLSSIRTIGFMFEEISNSAVLEEIGVDSLDNEWRIYNTDGILIGYGNSGEPSYSLVERGKIYIIVTNNNTYKYQRWK